MTTTFDPCVISKIMIIWTTLWDFLANGVENSMDWAENDLERSSIGILAEFYICKHSL